MERLSNAARKIIESPGVEESWCRVNLSLLKRESAKRANEDVELRV